MFSDIDNPDGLNKALLSQGCVLETAPSMGTVGRTYIPRTGVWVRSLRLPRSSCKSPGSHVLLLTSSNMNSIKNSPCYFLVMRKTDCPTQKEERQKGRAARGTPQASSPSPVPGAEQGKVGSFSETIPWFFLVG